MKIRNVYRIASLIPAAMCTIHQPKSATNGLHFINKYCRQETNTRENYECRYSHQRTTYTNEALAFFFVTFSLFPHSAHSAHFIHHFSRSRSLFLCHCYYLLPSHRYCSRFYVFLFIWQTIPRNAIKDYTL